MALVAKESLIYNLFGSISEPSTYSLYEQFRKKELTYSCVCILLEPLPYSWLVTTGPLSIANIFFVF